MSGEAAGAARRSRLPVFASLQGYRAGWLRGDLVAGLTVWAVLVPEALAYASIAGVSPVVGLYAAPGALIFYAAFGSSRHLVVGPMAATAALSAAAVGQVAAGKSGPGGARAAGGGAGGHCRGAPFRPAKARCGDRGSHHRGLPSFGLPRVPAADYLKLAGSALGVMLVGFAEGLGAARTYAARDGYQISPDRELVGLGAANLAAGLSSGMVVNGSLSKTAVNGSAGARTQASGLTVAVLTVITLLFLTGLFEDLPEATLSAVVIAALIELVDYKALQALYRAYSLRLGKIYGLARRRGVRLVLAGEIGQVRDMLAAVSGPDRSPEYHRTVHDAVDSARTGPGRAGAAGTGA